MTPIKNPQTLLEAVMYFSSEAVCVEFLSQIFWPDGERCCINCGSTEIYGMRTRPVFKCRDCKKQFSIKSGTVMAKSPLPITKWAPAIWMVVNCKNGISSYEMGRALGVSQQTAWFMNHRIREAIANNFAEKLSGTVESDSTYIGGAEKNRHKSKKKDVPGGGGKAIVFGAVERGGNVRSKVVEGTGVQDSENEVLSNVAIGSHLFTDEASGYRNMHYIYDHATVNHSKGEYVVGEAHTNTIENFWSLVKRCLKGTYIHVDPLHLDRYLQEQGFRYDHRKDNDSGRFIQAATMLFGKRLTYAELTGANKNQ
ncbi:MAG: IS1595 family transposase [Candidatus Kapaibacterium sp.]